MNLRRLAAPFLFLGFVLLTATVSAQDRQAEADRPPENPGREKSTSPATPPPATTQSITQSSDSAKVLPRATTDRLTTEATRFNALDTDRDGRISQAEFTLAPNKPIIGPAGVGLAGVSSPTRPANSRDEANASGANDSDIGSSTTMPELFQQLDTDKDGFLSRAELAADREKEVE